VPGAAAGEELPLARVLGGGGLLPGVAAYGLALPRSAIWISRPDSRRAGGVGATRDRLIRVVDEPSPP
jgi:hypothetical protein